MKFSQYSKQLDPDSGILQLMSDLGNSDTGDHPRIMLGGGNPAMIPDMETVFRREMKLLLEDGRAFETMLGSYDGPTGNQAFIDSLAQLFTDQYGWSLDSRNIAITNGSQSSFSVLFNLFGGPSSDGRFRRILLPMTPEYIGYGNIGHIEKSIFTANQPQIEYHDDRWFKYRLNLDDLDPGEEIGALCLSRPTNPTGNVATDQEVGVLRDIARKREIPFILDCAYGQPFPDIVFTEARPFWNTDIILCMSLSKLGLPGARTGIVIADRPIIEYVTSANAVFSLAPGRFGPTLMTNLIRSGEILSLSREVIRPWYRKRSDLAAGIALEVMKDLPVRIHESEGSIFLWFWFDGIPITSEMLYRRLKARGVFVIAGHHFFPGFAGQWRHMHECIRVSYAAPEEDLYQGLSIIAEEVRSAYDIRDKKSSVENNL